MNSCLSISPYHHPFTQAGCLKQLRLPSTLINRSQGEKYSIKCSQNKFYLTNKIENREDTSSRNYTPVTKYRVPLALQDGYVSKSEDANNSMAFQDIILKKINALYRLIRPYSVLGTVIGVISVSFLPLQSFADLTPKFFMGLLKALVPFTLMNIYQNSVNQLYDVEIDKINKPDLPLASGELSIGAGIATVSISSMLSFGMGIMSQSPAILWALVIYFFFASAYSVGLPFLRWKKNPYLTALCAFTVRGLVIQIANFIHIQKYVLGRPVVITRSLIFASTFICFLTVVLTLIKDLPDVDGDKEFGMQNITVKLGKERVLWLSVHMLLIAYGVAVVVGGSSPFMLSKLVTIIGHSTLALLLWLRARTVDLSSNASTRSFDMFFWKLYYAEYLLIPFVR